MGQCCARSSALIDANKPVPVSVTATTTPNKSLVDGGRYSRKSTVHPLVKLRSSDERSAINQLDGWIRRMQSVQDDDVKCATN